MNSAQTAAISDEGRAVGAIVSVTLCFAMLLMIFSIILSLVGTGGGMTRGVGAWKEVAPGAGAAVAAVGLTAALDRPDRALLAAVVGLLA